MKLLSYLAGFLRHWGTLGSVSAEMLPQEKILKTLSTHFLIADCAGQHCASGLFGTELLSTAATFQRFGESRPADSRLTPAFI